MSSNQSLATVLNNGAVQNRFKDVLGKRSASFISSIMSAVNTNTRLKQCDPNTVVSSAMIAATLDLPINQSLGFAHIVPYKNKATFQIGWKGYVQLAMRTGQYHTINVISVHDGDIKKIDRVSGMVELTENEHIDNPIVGYLSFFKLVSGFEKHLYWTKEMCEKHGKKYSQSYNNGPWKSDFDSMAKKTLVKQLISKWGIMSVELQKAITMDQSDGNEDKLNYPDNANGGFNDKPDISGEVKPKGQSAKSSAMSKNDFASHVRSIGLQLGFENDNALIGILREKGFVLESLEEIKEKDQGSVSDTLVAMLDN